MSINNLWVLKNLREEINCTKFYIEVKGGVIVNADIVWKPGKLQSVYNELRFYVVS